LAFRTIFDVLANFSDPARAVAAAILRGPPSDRRSGIQTCHPPTCRSTGDSDARTRTRACTVSLALEIDIRAIAGAITRATAIAIRETPRVSVPRSIRLNNQRRLRETGVEGRETVARRGETWNINVEKAGKSGRNAREGTSVISRSVKPSIASFRDVTLRYITSHYDTRADQSVDRRSCLAPAKGDRINEDARLCCPTGGFLGPPRSTLANDG